MPVQFIQQQIVYGTKIVVFPAPGPGTGAGPRVYVCSFHRITQSSCSRNVTSFSMHHQQQQQLFVVRLLQSNPFSCAHTSGVKAAAADKVPITKADKWGDKAAVDKHKSATQSLRSLNPHSFQLSGE